MDSSNLEVEPYHRPNASRLEPHEVFIVKMRGAGWPYHAIVARLQKDCDVRISITGLHDFCKSRRIAKNGSSASAERQRPSKPIRSIETTREPVAGDNVDDEDEWDFEVPKTLSTWKSRGEERPPPRGF